MPDAGAEIEAKPKPAWRKVTTFAQRRWKLLALLGALVVAFFIWRGLNKPDPAEAYRMGELSRGEIARVVSATGALEPLVKVEVGSTVSGLVESVGADFNSTVQVGDVLARLEPSEFEQRVTQAQANLAQAQAQLGVAEADFQRYEVLQQRGFVSDQLMTQQRAARDTARAAVAQARASLEAARIDLDRSIIRSPINGVVVDRQIDVGQSVAASFQAPTLFVIAQDLSSLQANIVVDEADIGEVREDMPVRFSVDAYPDRDFDGRVSQVRQQGNSESGVVSYTVVVEAENPGRSLLPGMTANADIIVEQKDDVLRLPNAALRFRPADEDAARAAQELMQSSSGAVAAEAPQAGGRGRALARLTEALSLTEAQQQTARAAARDAMSSGERPGPNMTDADRRAFQRRMRTAIMAALEPTLTDAQRQALAQMQAGGEAREQPARRAVVWVLRNNKPTPVPIEIGAADSAYTEVVGGELQPGDQVIIGGGPAGAGRQGGPMRGGGVRIRGA